jgi:hypothetical protein
MTDALKVELVSVRFLTRKVEVPKTGAVSYLRGRKYDLHVRRNRISAPKRSTADMHCGVFTNMLSGSSE